MKKSAGLYLSAREASAELAISQATLYAYVSRGLIRSEPSGDARARRYRADDVRSLLARRTPEGRGGEAEPPVLDSAISTITSEGSIYRGVHAVALAEQATLEQAATLLWDISDADPFAPGNLPVMSEAMHAVGEGKLFAFCRSGNRSTLAWAVARSEDGVSSDELCGVNSSAPFSVMSISSSTLTPNSPRM